MLKKLMCLLTLLLCFAGTAVAADHNPMAVIETNMGDIKIELFQKEAPISVKNFLDYAKKGFYGGTVFHRVIPNFMIQGGGMDANLTPKPTDPPIKNEATNGLKNDRGTLAMARTMIVDSATSQFFINVANNDFLNHRDNQMGYGYAVFGKVVSGMEVVDKIAATKTGYSRGMADVPATPVIIKAVKVLK
ncbi:peptidyl-prolyl cis-trans isomerase [Geomonas sp. Red32]|uniref:peptidylprolyl isomerase n=1 Tax=Geomonas sp. Red32 TaxID=2912856 RepID=UPI00202CCEB4|nr:peptidylprolyl isomerase [Geomonas sp. Red32]MCM0080653.1 peptidyl-prolyl cis-trans isomerase [Geomonas sp. Red32]